MKTTITFSNSNPETIENKLATKLNRKPSHEELKREVSRILSEARKP
jgi:DNA transposition AAA+ family ATPase